MDKALSKFIRKEKNGSVTIICDEAIVYIPENYFDTKAATWTGEGCSTLGILVIEFVVGEGKPKAFSLDIPLNVNIPSFRDKTKISKDFGNGKLDYVGLHLAKNDKLTNSSRHIQTLDSIIDFLNLFNNGKLPTSINYSELPQILKDSIQMNGMSTGVSSNMIEVMTAELSRLEKDETYPFRIQAGRTGAEKGYSFIGVKQLAEKTSVFSAVSFENINKAIRTSVERTRDKTEQYESPIEEIMYY